MNDRLPTEFEAKILRRIKRLGDLYGGHGLVHYVNAARRLERLGYTGKGKRWYLTDKGEQYLQGEVNK